MTDGVISDVNAPPVGIFSACSLSVEIKGGDFSTSDSCVEEGGGSCSRVLVDVSGVDTGSGNRVVSGDLSGDLSIVRPIVGLEDLRDVSSPKVRKWKRLARGKLVSRNLEGEMVELGKRNSEIVLEETQNAKRGRCDVGTEMYESAVVGVQHRRQQ
ncbi:hypothetical protein ACOSQ3_028164 [Xanthoceras sorbifolium]